MIKLTKDSNGQPVYVSPEAINFIEDADGASRIDVPHSLCFVKETPQEVAKKVLEYKLAFEQYRQSYASASQHHHDAQVLFEGAERDLVRLAGLEDTQ